jgi:ribosomal protein S18 acetylase RimI-like enzyme
MNSIRSLSIDEAPLVQALAHKIWPIAYKEILSQAQLDYMLNWMYSIESLTQQMQEGHHYFGIYESDEIVGFLDVQPNHPEIGFLKLYKFYVLPACHGRGFGYQLIQFAINFAENEQQKTIELQVNRHNKAKDFYNKIGFTIKEEKNFDIGNGYFMNDFVMHYLL